MKKIMLSAIAVAMGLGFGDSVSAHGYMDSPKARQAICEEQGGFWWPKDGSNIPNAACRAAYQVSGQVQFIQLHEFAANVPDYLNQAAVEAAVPDGELCSGGDVNKIGINTPSVDWQRTVVKPNANGTIKIRYRATTPHNPSFWQFYLSKPSVDIHAQPLNWADVELVQEHGNVEFFMAPDGKRYYEMDVAIPEKFNDEAILFSRWQRNDVVGEGFYNCSDITIERVTDPNPIEWHVAGYFIKQGQEANVGDTVWLRLFDANGQELIQQQLKVAADMPNWQQQLAEQVSLDFANLIQIGVKDAQGNVFFDNQNLLSNQVFVTDKNQTFNLTVVSAPKNTPPTVHTPETLILDENTSAHLHVHAFDDEQQTLDFSWQLPTPLTFTGAGSTITVLAPEVTADTEFVGEVSVSDGEFTKTVPLTVFVKNVPITNPDDTWQKDKAYSSGDTVVYLGKNYRARWWVKGDSPDSSQAWELIDANSGNEWQANQAYNSGDIVTYEGKQYQARWWTRGEIPTGSNVWKAL